MAKRILALVLVLICLIALSGCKSEQLRKVVFSGDTYEIQTDSMYPTFRIGDVIEYEKADPETLRVGDIIVYWTIRNGERVMNAHRIAAIYEDEEGTRVFETQGDANNCVDALTVHQSEVIGKYVRTVSGNSFP